MQSGLRRRLKRKSSPASGSTPPATIASSRAASASASSRRCGPVSPSKRSWSIPAAHSAVSDDVLILIEGVHQRIPDAPSGMQPIYIAPAPPGSESQARRRGAAGCPGDRGRSPPFPISDPRRGTEAHLRRESAGNQASRFHQTAEPRSPRTRRPGSAPPLARTLASRPPIRRRRPAPHQRNVPLHPLSPSRIPTSGRTPLPCPAHRQSRRLPRRPPCRPRPRRRAPPRPPSRRPDSGTAAQSPAPPKSTAPPTVSQPNPDVRKNPASLPGTPPARRLPRRPRPAPRFSLRVLPRIRLHPAPRRPRTLPTPRDA